MTRVVFMGSPEFAAPILQGLSRHYQIVGVVTQPDRPAGRGRQLKSPAIKLLAQQLGLPFIQPPKLRATEAMQQLREWSSDLIVVAAYGQILRPDILSLPEHGCINVHASLLPRWRGAAPIQAAILAGDSKTGVTIMKMDEGVDTGGVLSQREVQIGPEQKAGSLAEQLSKLGAELLVETLPLYLRGEIQPKAQDGEAATYAPILKKDDGFLDLSQPAEALARRVRAFNPRPGAYLARDGTMLKVHQAHAEAGTALPGQRVVRRGWPGVGTGSGILVLDEVQPAGKKAMEGRAFLSGVREWGSQQ